MQRKSTQSWFRQAGLAALAAAIALPLVSQVAQAEVISGTSTGTALVSTVQFTPLLGVSAALNVQTASATGSAPAPYNNSNSVLTGFVGVGANAILTAAVAGGQTNALTTNAASTVDLALGPRVTSSNATVNGLGVLVSATTLLDILSLNATTVQSIASVTGNFGALVPTGSTTIEAGAITVQTSLLALAINASLQASPAPNTTLGVTLDTALDLLGISITLNKQSILGDGSTNSSIQVDAIDIAFDNTVVIIGGVAGTLSGTLDISRSYAQMTAAADPTGPGGPNVPEPASLLLLSSAVAGLMMVRRRRSPH